LFVSVREFSGLTRVEFDRFKAFTRYSISLEQMNVLVGPNNSGVPRI
jgi:predicted ATP-dependent endonuclease of OLD family